MGDKSFTDSAHRGLIPGQPKILVMNWLIVSEAGTDPAKWEPAFMDAVQDPDVDNVIVVGSSDLLDSPSGRLPLNIPEKTFIMFDNPDRFRPLVIIDNIYAIAIQTE